LERVCPKIDFYVPKPYFQYVTTINIFLLYGPVGLIREDFLKKSVYPPGPAFQFAVEK